MKLFLVILFFSFSLNAQDIRCGLKSHAEIDICSVEDKFGFLMDRLYPNLEHKRLKKYNEADPCNPETADDLTTPDVVEICPEWDPKKDAYSYLDHQFSEDGLLLLSTYERLLMDSKPELSVFEAELEAYKTELKADLDFKKSIKGIKRLRRRMAKCGYNIPNAKLFINKIIKNKDVTKRDCLTSKTDELDTEDSRAASRVEIIKDLAFSKSLVVDFVALIRSGTKSGAKNKRLLNKLATVQGLLGVGDIASARDELLAISPDADLSQDSKDLIINKMNAYLGQ